MEDEQSYVDNFFWQIVDKSAKGSNITFPRNALLVARYKNFIFSREDPFFEISHFNSPFGF